MKEPSLEDLVQRLCDPACYSHPVQTVQVIQTHISYVLLTGLFAYKLKKPLNLGFLDFSTLEQRRFSCEEELRLNRRTAPELYLEVVAVTWSAGAPRLGGEGAVLEYAVKMRQFDPGTTLDELAVQGKLDAGCIDALASAVAAFHGSIPAAAPGAPYGDFARVAGPARANFSDLLANLPHPGLRERMEALGAWTARALERLGPLLEARRRDGFVRECHGDLHLGNVALIDGSPVPFDCVEFSPELRWIDVMNDACFAFMDLMQHGLPRLAWRFLGGYLEETGDYAGDALRRFYSVYRALVRAKVASLRARQSGVDHADQEKALVRFDRHIALAEALAKAQAPCLVITYGLSGSGKTTAARFLAEALGAIRLRSDVERKRLFRLNRDARTGSGPGEGIYGTEATRRTYARLGELARSVLRAGDSVIIDATFLRRAERERFRALGEAERAIFHILVCQAPIEVLRARVAARSAEANDASEANLAVLESQLARAEPPAPGEGPAVELDMDRPLSEVDRQCRRLADQLRAEVAHSATLQ